MDDGSQAEVFEGSVSASLKNTGDIHPGDTLEYQAKVTGNMDPAVIRWQVETEDVQTHEKDWKNIAEGERFLLIASADNLARKYRVALYDADGNLCAFSVLTLPEITAAQEETPADEEQGEPADDGQDGPAESDGDEPVDGEPGEIPEEGQENPDGDDEGSPAKEEQDEPGIDDKDESGNEEQADAGNEEAPAEKSVPEEKVGAKLFAVPNRGS